MREAYGETQLESDRRLIQGKIRQLESKIERVRQQRQLARRSRKKSEVPTVAIIGYTNAGKSTLFNQMTNAGVYVEDRLFATLDATLRSVRLPGAGSVIFADTVGFIRHIPHDLVAAFRSTLEETSEANLLVHLVDASDPHREEKMRDVAVVIKEVGAEDVPQLVVFNKIDALDPPVLPKVDLNEEGMPERVWISAANNQGIDLMMDAVAAYFRGQFINVDLVLAITAGKRRAALYELGTIVEEGTDEEGNSTFKMCLTQSEAEQIQKWPELLSYSVIA